jgi:hypothetical protein
MNESSNAPISGGMSSAPEPFYQVWIKAITKPNEQTFADIANSPDASPNKAYLWVFLTSLVSYFLIMVMTLIFSSLQSGGDMTTSLISVICGVPIGALVVTLIFAIDVAIVQWVAKLFKGVGTYGQLVYAMGAISAPVGLVSGVIGGLSRMPYIGLCFSVLTFGLVIYTIVLNVMAVKGVNKFGWGEAVGSMLLPGLVIGVLCACVVIAVLMLLGPIIGNVFSTINNSIGY